MECPWQEEASHGVIFLCEQDKILPNPHGTPVDRGQTVLHLMYHTVQNAGHITELSSHYVHLCDAKTRLGRRAETATTISL